MTDLSGLRSSPFYADEEFLAEDVLVTIIPNHRTAGPLPVSEGEFGPFRAHLPVKVPLWVALYLENHRLCTIEAPNWLNMGKSVYLDVCISGSMDDK